MARRSQGCEKAILETVELAFLSSFLPSSSHDLRWMLLGPRRFFSSCTPPLFSKKPTFFKFSRALPPHSPPPPILTMSSAPLVHSPPSSPAVDSKKPRLEEPVSAAPVVAEEAAVVAKEEAHVAAGLLPSGKQPKGKKSKDRKGKKGKRLQPDEAIMMDVEVFLGKGVVEEAVEKGLDWEVPAGLKEGEVVELRVGQVGSGGEFIRSFFFPFSLSLVDASALLLLFIRRRSLDVHFHGQTSSVVGHLDSLRSSRRAHQSSDPSVVEVVLKE